MFRITITIKRLQIEKTAQGSKLRRFKLTNLRACAPICWDHYNTNDKKNQQLNQENTAREKMALTAEGRKIRPYKMLKVCYTMKAEDRAVTRLTSGRENI